jgi:ribulose-5-phosphate 4-epimerase/fuculose-1-phosphate aldolase
VYGKAFSVFGRELDMITQDSLRFYKSHAVYDNFGGIVLDREEGKRIARCLGNGKAAILQNHGLLTVGQSVDEAAFWFLSLDKTCQAQLLVDAASAGSGHKKIFINDEEAAFTCKQIGTPEKGWLGSYFFLLSSKLVTNFFNKHSKVIMMSSWQRQGAPF